MSQSSLGGFAVECSISFTTPRDDEPIIFFSNEIKKVFYVFFNCLKVF